MRDLHYMKKSLKELLKIYAYEKDRDNKSDAKTTQKAIINEVYTRIDRAFRIIDNNKNVNIESLYSEIIQAAEK